MGAGSGPEASVLHKQALTPDPGVGERPPGDPLLSAPSPPLQSRGLATEEGEDRHQAAAAAGGQGPTGLTKSETGQATF